MSPTKKAAAFALLIAAAFPLAGCGLIDDAARVASKGGDEVIEAGAASTRADEARTATRPADPAPPAAEADSEVAPVAAEVRDRTGEALVETELEEQEDR